MNLEHTKMTDQTAADLAYEERNRLVAALARLFPSGVRKTSIEGWDPAWQNCVFIDLPTGQASWHFHDREAHLFDGLPAYDKPWDGHTTPEKYVRLAALRCPRPLPRRVTLVDPDGDHTAIYVDGHLVASDNGMDQTARFIAWMKDQSIQLPFELTYRYIELAEGSDAESNFPPDKEPAE